MLLVFIVHSLLNTEAKVLLLSENETVGSENLIMLITSARPSLTFLKGAPM